MTTRYAKANPSAGQTAKIFEATEAQRARFLAAARKAGCEENFDQFDDALRKVAKAKPEPKAPPVKAKKAPQKG